MGTLADTRVVEEKPSTDDFNYEYIERFKGLNLSVALQDIDVDELGKAEGIRLEEGKLVSDTGVRVFGPTVPDNPRAVVQLITTTDAVHTLLITDGFLYKWNSTFEEWNYVSDGTSTTISTNEASGQTTLSVTSETGFADDDYVGIVLNDGSMDLTRINGSPSSGIIVVDDALTGAADAGNIVLKAKVLTGDGSVPISWTVYPLADWLVFTNGIDTPQRFNGSTCVDVPGLIAAFTTFLANLVFTYKDYLVFANTTEGGTVYPQRVRNSDLGDGSNWTTNDATYTDLLSKSDHIRAVAHLDPYVIIYKETSIVRMEWVGQPTQIFGFTGTVSNEGARTADSVINLGDKHVLFGKKNIYEYQGGFDLKPIGDKIKPRIFGNKAELKGNAIDTVIMIDVQGLDEFWILYPRFDNDTPYHFLRRDVDEELWHERTLPFNVIGKGEFLLKSTTIWANLVGDWTEQNGTWVSRGARKTSATILLCSNTPTKQVYEYDFGQTDDAGTAIPVEIISKQWYMPNREQRFDRFEFLAMGTSIQFSYSIDKDDEETPFTWVDLTVFTKTGLVRTRDYKQFTFGQIQFRWKGTGNDFQLKWFGFRHKRESIW